MQSYSDEEKLELTQKVHITTEAMRVLREHQKILKKQGRKVSLAKIVCNLIITNLDKDEVVL